MSSSIKKAMEVLKETKEHIKETGKYQIAMVNIEKACQQMGVALTKARKLEDGSYSEWMTVQPPSKIYGKMYGTAKNIANLFSDGREFTFRDFKNEAGLKIDNYDGMLLKRELERLHGRGFLDRSKVITEKGKRIRYRVNKRGLDMLQIQAMESAEMRKVD